MGLPVFGLWFAAVLVTFLLTGKIWWLAGYAAFTWLGLRLYYRLKKLAVAVHNGLRHPALRPRMLAFHQTVLQSLPDESA